MILGVLWVFLLAGLISPMVNGQFTQDYETTDDSFDDIHDDDQNEENTDTNDDYGDVFDDYFDDEMRVVDVDQDVVIKACVSNSDALVKKIDSAYNKCFKDFEDWNEFQKNNVGNDKDNDGLSDEYEADEACFYKEVGWVVNNKADKDAIKKDFENLNLNNVKNEFVSSIDACSGWNGKFKGRKKRDAEEDSWALSLARERRDARNKDNRKPGKGRNSGKGKDGKRRKNTKPGKGKGKNKKESKKKERKERRTRKNGNGRKEKNKNQNKVNNRKDRKNKKEKKDKKKDREDKKTVRNGKGKGNRKGKGKGNRKGKGNGNRKGKGKGNGKGKGKENGLSKDEKKTMKQLLPESVYNQLWCYELSVERALEECIEAKILP